MRSYFLAGVALLAAGLLATGCGSKPTPDGPTGEVLMHTDFENLEGWLAPSQESALTTERAHSGKYATKVDRTTGYGLNYATALGQLSSRRVNKIRLDAWIFTPEAGAGVVLVTHVDQPGNPKPLLWDGLNVSQEAGKYGEWVHLNKVITLPDGINAASTLGVYLWRTNENTGATYLDDLTISNAE